MDFRPPRAGKVLRVLLGDAGGCESRVAFRTGCGAAIVSSVVFFRGDEDAIVIILFADGDGTADIVGCRPWKALMA